MDLVKDRAALLRLRQGAERAERTGRASPARFVTGEERAAAVHEARSAGVLVAFDGGWEDAEREQACFYPPEEEPVFTHVWLEARWNARFGACDHRALLGSLMALGIDRSFFGDLIAQADCAYLCALPEAARRLPEEWTRAGSVSLSVRELAETPTFERPCGAMLRDTVASLRLDCVLASGLKCSRARAAELIRAGHAEVEHRPEERIDRLIAPGQMISVHGFGRVRLAEAGEETRKGRIPIRLEIFSRGR